jgi:hypothetical protein
MGDLHPGLGVKTAGLAEHGCYGIDSRHHAAPARGAAG